jgi:hypothetical protein
MRLMEIPKAIDQMFTYFAVVHAPRRQPPTTLQSLEAMLTITLLATMCGAHNWVASEPWGQAPHQGLAEFLDLPPGLPSHDTFGRVFALLAPTKLQRAFIAWMSALAQLAEEVMALEGQTIRRSLERADGQGAIHVVSTWASLNELGLAQFKVDTKSNESTALPELLAMLNRHGSVVTIAAMGGQVESVRQVVDQGGDAVLSLKENQPG